MEYTLKKKNITDIRELRTLFRAAGGKGAYSEKEYRALVMAHYVTLHKYMYHFHVMYELETGRKLRPKYPSIHFFYDYFLKHKHAVISGFLKYFENKTHFSYELFCKPKPSKIKKKMSKQQWIDYWNNRTQKDAHKTKLAEFVVLILAEYMILHNFMWAGKIKPSQVKTIDSFMENVR